MRAVRQRSGTPGARVMWELQDDLGAGLARGGGALDGEWHGGRWAAVHRRSFLNVYSAQRGERERNKLLVQIF
jgi:hypothetical protein